MTYNLFISHSWTYEFQYERLISLLKKRNDFSFKNYSVPKDEPIYNRNDKQLKEAIGNQIRQASCVLILAGVYASYSKWINIEIELAQLMGKKIIGIEPWGADRTSEIVKKASGKVVKWNTDSIIDAIIN